MAKKKKKKAIPSLSQGIKLSVEDYIKLSGKASEDFRITKEKFEKGYTHPTELESETRKSKLIQQALQQALQRKEREDVRKEVEFETKTPTQRFLQKVSPETRRTDQAISRVARKAISLVAPKGGIVKALTSTAKKKPGGGRGRPHGTYKTRFVPGVGAVKVPTHIYKKMMAKSKADARLARVQQQLDEGSI